MLAAMAAALALSPAAPAASAIAQHMPIDNDLSKCGTAANGPAILVTVTGFKTATGRIRVQSYPGTAEKWLKKGAWINRIDVPATPRGDAMRFCMPLPGPGAYGIAVRHDLDGNGKSGWNDGGGFSNNPDISLFNLKPSVRKAALRVDGGVKRIDIVLNYRSGTSIEPIG